jgi:hypothetical protein
VAAGSLNSNSFSHRSSGRSNPCTLSAFAEWWRSNAEGKASDKVNIEVDQMARYVVLMEAGGERTEPNPESKLNQTRPVSTQLRRAPTRSAMSAIRRLLPFNRSRRTPLRVESGQPTISQNSPIFGPNPREQKS